MGIEPPGIDPVPCSIELNELRKTEHQQTDSIINSVCQSVYLPNNRSKAGDMQIPTDSRNIAPAITSQNVEKSDLIQSIKGHREIRKEDRTLTDSPNEQPESPDSPSTGKWSLADAIRNPPTMTEKALDDKIKFLIPLEKYKKIDQVAISAIHSGNRNNFGGTNGFISTKGETVGDKNTLIVWIKVDTHESITVSGYRRVIPALVKSDDGTVQTNFVFVDDQGEIQNSHFVYFDSISKEWIAKKQTAETETETEVEIKPYNDKVAIGDHGERLEDVMGRVQKEAIDQRHTGKNRVNQFLGTRFNLFVASNLYDSGYQVPDPDLKDDCQFEFETTLNQLRLLREKGKPPESYIETAKQLLYLTHYLHPDDVNSLTADDRILIYDIAFSNQLPVTPETLFNIGLFKEGGNIDGFPEDVKSFMTHQAEEISNIIIEDPMISNIIERIFNDPLTSLSEDEFLSAAQQAVRLTSDYYGLSPEVTPSVKLGNNNKHYYDISDNTITLDPLSLLGGSKASDKFMLFIAMAIHEATHAYQLALKEQYSQGQLQPGTEEWKLAVLNLSSMDILSSSTIPDVRNRVYYYQWHEKHSYYIQNKFLRHSCHHINDRHNDLFTIVIEGNRHLITSNLDFIEDGVVGAALIVRSLRPRNIDILLPPLEISDHLPNPVYYSKNGFLRLGDLKQNGKIEGGYKIGKAPNHLPERFPMKVDNDLSLYGIIQEFNEDGSVEEIRIELSHKPDNV